MIIYVKLLLTAIFWGGTFIAGRIIVNHVDTFSAAFLRFFIAAACLVLITRQKTGRLPLVKKNQVIPLVLLGATGVFSYNIFFFMGLERIEAGRAAAIIANNPIVIALFAALFLKEKLSALKLFGIFLSIGGAMIVIARGQISQLLEGGFGFGEFYIVGCVFSWAAFSLIGKTVLKDLSPLISITYSAVIGCLLLFFPALFSGVFEKMSGYSPADWAGIFYLGFFGTVVGFVWYYEGIQKIGATKASIFINFVPISGILLAFILLGEALSPSLLAGTVLVCVGVFLTNSVRS